MSLLEECQEHFQTDDLYEVFRLERTATAAEVKKAYYKMSMIYHPDKAGENEAAKQTATVQFQLVSKIYSILSDTEKRKIYDETGSVDEENVLSDEESVNLWRTVFKKVTKEDIENFFVKYKGSEEEEQDILTAYQKCDGEMNRMLEYINLSSSDEEPRVKEIVDRLIEKGSLKATKKYKSSTGKGQVAKRARKAAKEAKEAEEALKEIEKKEGGSDLEALILKRQADRSGGNFLDNLAVKYAPKPKKSKK